ncbi:MAG: 4Fe-4S binding protein [Deltaproteobacteria bacterium]|nr:4Fe-4S binding protein [Deltaproteobacteria bacterium]
MRGTILINPEECIDCKACEEECASIHQESCLVVETREDLSIPVLCQHCDAAICAMVCPTAAIKRMGMKGPVIVDNDLCVGCRSCIIVCPYGVLKLKKNGKGIVKCDLCIERLDRMEKPACVEACPTDALTFKSVGSGSEQDEKDR